MADSFGLAFYKAQEAARPPLPTQGSVLLTVSVRDRGPMLVEVARRFEKLAFTIKATEGTQQFLAENGVASERILKMHEGRPNIVDGIMNGEIQLVVNTPAGKLSATDDSYIRKAAIKHKVPHITTLAAAKAAAEGITARREGVTRVRSLQEYHAGIE
jgi:carbamoyl-phosphate synthase large subunit